MKLISVLIPLFNHSKYIEDAILSVSRQTYPDLELIIIDDGSIDNSYEKAAQIVRTVQTRFHRIVVKKQENHGARYTLNKLLSIANGELVLILASDDLLSPQAIATLAEYFTKNRDCVLAVGDNKFIDEQGAQVDVDYNFRIANKSQAKRLSTFSQKFKFCRKKAFLKYQSLIKGNYIPNGYLIDRKKLILSGGYSSDVTLEDWYMLLQLVKYGRFYYSNDICCYYRLHSNNTVFSSSFRKKQILIAYEIYSHEFVYCFRNRYIAEWIYGVLVHFVPYTVKNLIKKIYHNTLEIFKD